VNDIKTMIFKKKRGGGAKKKCEKIIAQACRGPISNHQETKGNQFNFWIFWKLS